ncbi:ATP-binding protein [Zoogloea sp.]|uniref:ATP-binding protein n=1 Tax=Zoogloea sp. TaxID=49181 RepID=UPI00261AE310|nr:ATP-binding protein [uncultured Zoogloea sp.]
MNTPLLARLRAPIDAWLRATSLGRRLTLLSVLSVAGLAMLLVLNLLSSTLKDAYFDSIEALNLQQRQLQHFKTETARLQASIRQYLAMPEESLVRQIDGATEQLFAALDTAEKSRGDYADELASLRQSLRSFVGGYHELKRINLEIDRIYHSELLESGQQSARLLSLMLSSSAENKGQTLIGPASRSLIDAFVDALLKMNAYYARREVNVSLATRTSLERVAQLSPLIEQLTHNAFERAVLRDLGERTHRMISGLGSLQRAYARRGEVMERQIEASQHDIARIASSLDERYGGIEASLRARYTSRLAVVKALSVTIGAVVVGITLLLGVLVAASIREPLRALLRTVEAFSRGRFDEPVPDVGDNELGRLAGALREFRQSAGQRALAERALRESEARLRTLSDMSSDVFWELDADFRYTTLSGLRASELLAQRVIVFGVRPWDNPAITGEPLEWSRLRAALESHQPFRDLQFQIQVSDGGAIHLQVSGDPVFGPDGDFCGFRGTGKDISKQKAVEAEIRRLNQSLEQRVAERTTELRQTNERLAHALEHLVHAEKLASLGNLVAGVAHELNTPLGNTLLTASHLRTRVRELHDVFATGAMRRSELASFIELSGDGLELIERNLHRAAGLLANFKQVAVDQTSAQRRHFDLRKTVDEVVATLMPGLRKRKLRLVVEIPEGLELDSFPGPLEQVIANIVTNAAVHAFGPDEAGELTIAARPLEPGEIELRIRDNGHGIPPEIQGRVFDPFFTTRMGQGGSGLGLYIVYNIVTSLLGGGIEVRSTPEGTCFTMRFPACAPDAPQGLASVLSVVQAPPPPDRA